MSNGVFQEPVKDTVPKINDEVAVGEDLDFQRRWWKFEGIMWWAFALILALDLAGALGRGPLAHAHMGNAALDVKYERIERAGTPSILRLKFNGPIPAGGRSRLYVSQSIVDELGTQRVIPAPSESTIGEGGVTYTFPINSPGASVEFALQPAHAGIYRFVIGIPGQPLLQSHITVVP